MSFSHQNFLVPLLHMSWPNMDHSISGLHILLYHYVSIFISIIHCLNYCTFNYCAIIVNLKIKWHQFSSFVLFQDDFSFFRTFAFSQKFGITPSISKVDLVLFFFFFRSCTFDRGCIESIDELMENGQVNNIEYYT